MNSATKTAILFHVRNIEASNPLGHPVGSLMVATATCCIQFDIAIKFIMTFVRFRMAPYGP